LYGNKIGFIGGVRQYIKYGREHVYRVTKRVLLGTAVFAGELVVVMEGMPIRKG